MSRKTLYAFHFAITQLMMHRGFSSWTFSNSPFRWLLKVVQNFKDWAIFDQVIKEILTEGQNKIQQNCSWIKSYYPKITFHHFHNLWWMYTLFQIWFSFSRFLRSHEFENYISVGYYVFPPGTVCLLGEPSKHEMSQIVEKVHNFLDPCTRHPPGGDFI